ncbi:MAG TPA: hypothetical protein VKS43_01230 [Burkholderiales bacterium]|nr:hypothetical protein [Burkholderiales bacterium]
MNVNNKSKLRGANVGLLGLLLLGGCAMITPKEKQQLAPPLGSTWVMARSDSGSFGSEKVRVAFKRGERIWNGEHVITFDSPGSTSLAHDNGRLVALVSGDKLLMSFEPDLGFARPLEVGHASIGSYRMTIPGQEQSVHLLVTQKVVAYEEVKVPAGTFKTYKIIWSESNGNEDTYWMSPELGICVKSILRRTAEHTAGPGTREDELVSYSIAK